MKPFAVFKRLIIYKHQRNSLIIMNENELKKAVQDLSENKALAQKENLSFEKLRSECIYFWECYQNEKPQQKGNFLGCSWESILQLILKVVRSKYLSLSKKQNSAFLTPRSGIMTLAVGYSAYMAAMRENGLKVTVSVANEGDVFAVNLTENGYKVKHDVQVFGLGTPIVYFAQSTDKDGFSQVVVMDKTEIQKRKATAATKFIWDAWEKEMSLKTVLQRLANFYYRDLLAELLEVDFQEIELTPEAKQPALPKPELTPAAKVAAIPAAVANCKNIESLNVFWVRCQELMTDENESQIKTLFSEKAKTFGAMYSNQENKYLCYA